MNVEFKIALAQIESKRCKKKDNLEKFEKLVSKAKSSGASLIVFPEMSLTGYLIRDKIFELAETIPGESTVRIEEIAKKTETYIIFGMPEVSDNSRATVYNSAVLIGPEGIIGKYRKMHLPTHSVFEEKRYFRAGYQLPVFKTEVGKIGLCICYDIFFPEVTRLLRLKGADLIVCISASPAVRKSYFEILTAARALENTSFLAYVNLVGVHDGLQFWGGSRLITPSGDIIAKGKDDIEELIISKVDFSEIKKSEIFIPTLKDIRPELFIKLASYAENF